MWQLKNRGRDLNDLNCLSITAMINLLKHKGHQNAELVIVNDRGIRPEGYRHPHSWSIGSGRMPRMAPEAVEQIAPLRNRPE